ncbi:SET domain-containing protein [Mycena indigotica]|uniref:SET domain-containing protein n=1 Tax=Mycena indigotica TaxID=2126181 RepID=A0A8H6TAR6_9AGAR|nr:SET domain-containing protein [Mycena indigotica]KAF7315058.1 SET domain-containing protein [Mycena indigotica]
MKRGFLKAKTVVTPQKSPVEEAALNPSPFIGDGGYMYCTIPQDAPPNEPVSECCLPPETVANLLKIPGFPHPMQPIVEVLFRLGESPEKGLGLFATRAITQGEVLLDRRPLLVSSMSQRPLTTKALEAMIAKISLTGQPPNPHKILSSSMETIVGRMRPENRAAYMALANSTPDSPVLGIFDTNGAGIVDAELNDNGGPTCTYSAVCDIISRMNHSCCPNTSRVFDKNSFSIRLYAARNIAKSEELTFPYVDLLSCKADRQENLDEYGFVCTCHACVDPASDDHREDIHEFEFDPPRLLKWARDKTLPDDWLLKKCYRQLELLEQEGLQSIDEYWEVLADLSRVYLCFGDIKNAREWAARAYQCQWIHCRRFDRADIDVILGDKYEQSAFWCLRQR